MVKEVNIKTGLVLLGCWVFSLSAFASTIIEVNSDRNPVSLNESFQLVYESSDSVDDDPDFSPLEPYLDILNRSQSSNISIINGRYSSKKSWNLTVMAKQTGQLTLPPISFGTDQSASYKLKVNPPTVNSPQQAEFFTRMKLSLDQVFVQQQLVITQQLFSARKLSAYGMSDPEFSGMDVLIEPLGQEKKYKTRLANRAYLVVERSYAVYPQSSGKLKLESALAEARIGTGSNSIFDSFGARSKIMRARSSAVEIDVKAVPVEANMNPWLPASEFELHEQWPNDPPEFVQGEPLTRTISIKADGLTATQLPVLPAISMKGLKLYPDQPMLTDIKNDSGITGHRLEKVALIPTRIGDIELPAIEIPWWNTRTQRREVARIPARTIQVLPSKAMASSSASAIPPEKPVEPLHSEIPTQQPVAEAVKTDTLSSGLIMLTIVIALGWIGTLLAWFFSARKIPKPFSTEQSPVKASVKQHYKRLVSACERKDAEECRAQLLEWAKSRYSGSLNQGSAVTNLYDLLPRLSSDLAAEIKKIDAVIYGGHKQDINFQLIVEQVGRLMHKEKENPLHTKTVLLEPLYK